MNVIRLTREQLVLLYPLMEATFPDDELKPLDIMLESFDQGLYDCLGLQENGQMPGYTLFVRHDGHVLLDYFFILHEHRSRGLGSSFLQLLKDYFSQMESVIVEIEDPEMAEDDPGRQIALRRMDFYLRNGFVNTDVRVQVFHVHYLLLVYDAPAAPHGDQLRDQYRALYQDMLPPEMFSQFIHI